MMSEYVLLFDSQGYQTFLKKYLSHNEITIIFYLQDSSPSAIVQSFDKTIPFRHFSIKSYICSVT